MFLLPFLPIQRLPGVRGSDRRRLGLTRFWQRSTFDMRVERRERCADVPPPRRTDGSIRISVTP
eukprot:16437244-Heterocapsa_arctica.AAC.1